MEEKWFQHPLVYKDWTPTPEDIALNQKRFNHHFKVSNKHFF